MPVTKESYFSRENDKYMSFSQYRTWAECPQRWFHEYVDPGVKPPAPSYYLEGQFGHSFFEGEEALEEFIKTRPVCKKNKPGELLSSYADILEGCRKAATNKQFMEYLVGFSEYILCPVSWGGVEWKSMFDKIDLSKKRIVDIKFMSTYDLDEPVPFYEKYGYWTQMAIYKKLAELYFGIEFSTYIAVIEKNTDPMYDIIEMSDKDRLLWEQDSVEKNLPRIMADRTGFALNNCEKCYVCRNKRIFSVKQAKSIKGEKYGEEVRL